MTAEALYRAGITNARINEAANPMAVIFARIAFLLRSNCQSTVELRKRFVVEGCAISISVSIRVPTYTEHSKGFSPRARHLAMRMTVMRSDSLSTRRQKTTLNTNTTPRL